MPPVEPDYSCLRPMKGLAGSSSASSSSSSSNDETSEPKTKKKHALKTMVKTEIKEMCENENEKAPSKFTGVNEIVFPLIHSGAALYRQKWKTKG